MTRPEAIKTIVEGMKKDGRDITTPRIQRALYGIETAMAILVAQTWINHSPVAQGIEQVGPNDKAAG